MAEAILLSGGMDSLALAYWRRPQVAITVDYGQRPARAEIQAAEAACGDLAIEHVVVRADCSAIGSGDLAGTTAVPLAPMSEWWPFRNQLLLTLAGSVAVVRGVETLLLGIVSSDAAHADGTVSFVEAASRLMQLQEGTIRARAPAAAMTSAELIRESRIPRHVLAWAHSCHIANFACGRCRGCLKHYSVLTELGLDPY